MPVFQSPEVSFSRKSSIFPKELSSLESATTQTCNRWQRFNYDLTRNMKMRDSIFKYFAILLFAMTSFDGFAQENSRQKGFSIAVNSKVGEISMTKNEFETAVFSVHSFHPEFVGRIGIKGFSVKYPGQKEIKINGNQLNEQAKQGLKKLSRGDQILVYDALSVQDGNYRVDCRGFVTVTIL